VKYRALVVDDDRQILEAVADILTSLGHAYDLASTQEEARGYLGSGRHDYVLLDLEIPVRQGGLPRIQNGLNLLAETLKAPGMENVPVIVMTAHGRDGPHLAVEAMKTGAVD
jgi:DNA-binding NtrC family response regulator